MPYADRTKQREYQLQWMHKRRNAYFAASNGCVQCGSFENLELDHIDRSQKVDHRIWSWSQKRREVELAKCQVLCTDCHKQKSIAERIKTPPHGTINRYKTSRFKCRCSECRNANRIYQQQYRQK